MERGGENKVVFSADAVINDIVTSPDVEVALAANATFVMSPADVAILMELTLKDMSEGREQVVVEGLEPHHLDRLLEALRERHSALHPELAQQEKENEAFEAPVEVQMLYQLKKGKGMEGGMKRKHFGPILDALDRSDIGLSEVVYNAAGFKMTRKTFASTMNSLGLSMVGLDREEVEAASPLYLMKRCIEDHIRDDAKHFTKERIHQGLACIYKNWALIEMDAPGSVIENAPIATILDLISHLESVHEIVKAVQALILKLSPLTHSALGMDRTHKLAPSGVPDIFDLVSSHKGGSREHSVRVAADSFIILGLYEGVVDYGNWEELRTFLQALDRLRRAVETVKGLVAERVIIDRDMHEVCVHIADKLAHHATYTQLSGLLQRLGGPESFILWFIEVADQATISQMLVSAQ